MDTTITVLGATGNVGSRVAGRLARAGARVRPVGRDPDRLAAMVPEGVTPVVADLTDPASLAPALDGADAACLVFPSVAADPVAPDVVATLAQRVPRVVYLSSAGTEGAVEGDGTIPGSHALVERLVRDSVPEWTLLRAGGFATNTLAWAAQTHGGGDEIRWFGPGITRALVHEDDGARGIVRAQMEMAVTPEPRTDEIERLLGRPATSYARWARDHEEDFR